MKIDEIKRCIPHREPFLWLDEVTEITESHIICRKHLAGELPVFQGHYPNFPVFPGVLQCEASFQAAAVLISRIADVEEGQVPVVTRVNNVQFRRMVRPGDTLIIRVDFTEQLANAFCMKGRVSVDSKVSARLDFICATAPVN